MNTKRRKKVHDTERRAGFEAMLRQITESVLITKITSEDNVMN